MLIDDYDNFANTILAYHGEQAYHSFTHGGGFYRNFFATLKAGAGHGGGLERLFITGVSPITMDDVTSGFNIAANISLERRFNELLGFTAAEVRGVLETYQDHGVLRPGRGRSAGRDGRVVQRLPVRQGRPKRSLQHGHGPLLREGIHSERRAARTT